MATGQIAELLSSTPTGGLVRSFSSTFCVSQWLIKNPFRRVSPTVLVRRRAAKRAASGQRRNRFFASEPMPVLPAVAAPRHVLLTLSPWKGHLTGWSEKRTRSTWSAARSVASASKSVQWRGSSCIPPSRPINPPPPEQGDLRSFEVARSGDRPQLAFAASLHFFAGVYECSRPFRSRKSGYNCS